MVPQPSEKITVYTNKYSPFAHRVNIALAELGLEFEEVTIDLGKPREPWYLELNPRGQVPVLKYGDHIVTESLIITEFLADLFPSNLLPPPSGLANSLLRARIHYISDTFEKKILPLFRDALLDPAPRNTTTETRTAIGNDLVTTAEKELEPLLHDANPFFGGSDKLTLAEVNISVFLLRLYALAKEENGELIPKEVVERLDRLKNFARWSEKVRSHPSVTKFWDEEEVVQAMLKRFNK